MNIHYIQTYTYDYVPYSVMMSCFFSFCFPENGYIKLLIFHILEIENFLRFCIYFIIFMMKKHVCLLNRTIRIKNFDLDVCLVGFLINSLRIFIECLHINLSEFLFRCSIMTSAAIICSSIIFYLKVSSRWSLTSN